MTQERVTCHIVGSLYNCSDAAGHRILSLLKKNLQSNISCRFNNDSHFIVYVSHDDNDDDDDKSLSYLTDSIKNLISSEKNRGLELFEDEKITRKSGTHPSLTLAALIENKAHAIETSGKHPLVEHENVIQKWSPNELKLSLQLLERIGSLCGCRIEQANESSDLLLKADKENNVKKGISKLERVNRMIVDEMSFPRIHSFCILEGEISANLQLIALKDLNDKRSVTTLLSKDSSIEFVRDLCVLVLIKGSDIVQVKSKPAASNQGNPLWNNHVYNCGQAQDLAAAKTPKEPETTIDKWVFEVTDPNKQLDAFRPESTVIQQPVDVGTVYEKPLSPTKKPVTKRSRIARGNPDANNDKRATIQDRATCFSNHQPTEDMSVRTESQPHYQPPRIEPPYLPSPIMPPPAMPSGALSKIPSITSRQLIPSSSTWNVVLRGGKSGSLIDLSIPNEGHSQGIESKDETMAVIDSLQDTTKAKTSDLKFTMNQRKAPRQTLVRGNTALVRSFEETSVHLLALALPRTGQVELAVDIGRLLINQQRGLSEFKNRSFKTSELSSILPGERPTGFEPMFTKMLTVRSSEAESIGSVLLPYGRRLFHQQAISRRVTYVFNCKAKSGDQIVVVCDENGGSGIQGSEVLIGALDWYFPKRAWDARLRLASESFLTTDYQRQVKGIVDNLKIAVSEDGQALDLWTKTMDENFGIESITLRRETLHPATIYPDLILHLTECQDLQVRQSSDSESIYGGSIQSPNAMIKANRLWWEAKISSTSAAAMLQENATLELGEKATWTPSSIINTGVVRDLFAAAQEIVTQIDHVGFFHRGEGSAGSKTTKKPSENTQDVPASLRRVDPAFW